MEDRQAPKEQPDAAPAAAQTAAQTAAGTDAERLTALEQLEVMLRTPMVVLSLLWLLLVIMELAWQIPRALEVFGTVIWIIFILEFSLRLWLAPHKVPFLRKNWLTIIALAVPAVRLLQAFRALRALRLLRLGRGVQLVRIIGTANRGMNALKRALSRRGLGYVGALTLAVVLLGAGGMLFFEPAAQLERGGFTSFGHALWWTGMLITGMGTDVWPVTVEGRILAFLLALYGFAVFGYITASLASFFVGQDAGDRDAPVAGSAELDALRAEIAALREALEKRV